MKVLVDTSVWSLAMRRKQIVTDPYVDELKWLIREVRVQMIGPIRQEILSGIRYEEQYIRVRDRLRAYPDLAIASADYEVAASFFNTARQNGIQGSNTDFLICAVSSRHNMPVMTNDEDFLLFQQHIPVLLHKPRNGIT